LSLTNYSDVLDKLSTSGYRCRIDYVNKRIYFNINADSYTSTNDSLVINTWYHIAITRNDTNLKIYINGVENSSYDAPPKVTTLSNNLIVGNNSSLNLKLRGYIDDLKMFNAVLTQDQIKEIMKQEEIDISYYNIKAGDRIYDKTNYPATSDLNYKVIDSVEQWHGFLRLKLRNETV
jgi:fibronectin type 3 domain-containing protein